jgi:hypothetical protein
MKLLVQQQNARELFGRTVANLKELTVRKVWVHVHPSVLHAGMLEMRRRVDELAAQIKKAPIA